MGSGFARRGVARLPTGEQRLAQPPRLSEYGGTVREEPRSPHLAAGRLHGHTCAPAAVALSFSSPLCQHKVRSLLLLLLYSFKKE